MEKEIFVDWGTSNFRAYQFDESGRIIREHQAAAGILSVTNGAFEATLHREIGEWIQQDSVVSFSGMITSRNGWVETPYVDAPADLLSLAKHAQVSISSCGAKLRFLPGVSIQTPLPDVMRGEEIQIFGSIHTEENVTIVLPGTHSKWVRVERGRIVAFRTFLTGEMYALLKMHSIVGRLGPNGTTAFNECAFLAGVEQSIAAHSAGLLNDVFTVRSGVLLKNFSAAHIADRLSGVLIGHELRNGLALGWSIDPLRLVGDAMLCERYRLAFAAVDVSAELGPEHAAVAGFRNLVMLEGRHR